MKSYDKRFADARKAMAPVDIMVKPAAYDSDGCLILPGYDGYVRITDESSVSSVEKTIRNEMRHLVNLRQGFGDVCGCITRLARLALDWQALYSAVCGHYGYEKANQLMNTSGPYPTRWMDDLIVIRLSE